ncbi:MULTISPECIES: hypothetical protein [Bacillus]|uniref:hypothetical protein n=1 Tax=Bacillus TaxID=1386 RepID=UPI00042504D6|nr:MULTISPECIES: hypothetical protein [Bacillus]QHZ47662.1 hypothetical protein M654_015845 [Bacillus sp. NSP9.1]WFA03714.1 hypothetical protein P3X63_13665 [Bacillus sp. HSf4]
MNQLLRAERNVKKSVYLYLKDNEQFDCELIKDETGSKDESKDDGSKEDDEKNASTSLKAYTESELKAVTKAGKSRL